MFKVKEIFYTIQGEGANAGRAAVFVRFAGCNGWSGRASDRANGPLPCSLWCDTDFRNGSLMSEAELIERANQLFPSHAWRMVVLTGGEPALQLTNTLLRSLLDKFPCVAIETNGSLPLPELATTNCWLTVSPKTEKIVQDKAAELKLIFPTTIAPEKFDYIKANWRYLQPLDDGRKMQNTEAAVRYVKEHPQWRLSIQMQKYAGFP